MVRFLDFGGEFDTLLEYMRARNRYLVGHGALFCMDIASAPDSVRGSESQPPPVETIREVTGALPNAQLVKIHMFPTHVACYGVIRFSLRFMRNGHKQTAPSLP